MAHFDDQSALIRALYASAAGGETGTDQNPAPWGLFLERLGQVTQADGGALCIEQEGRLHGLWSIGTCPELAPELRQGLRNDRVYAQENLPAGAISDGYIRVVKVRTGQAAQVVIWACRAEHRKDFRSADGQKLSALVPYLGQAGDIWIALDRERRRAALNARLGADLGAGWILFDRSGTVLDISAGLPAGKSGLCLSPRRRLELSDPLATQRLRAALAACAAGTDGPVSVILAHDPVVELVLMSAPGPGAGLVTGFLRETPIAARLPPEQIARHFGLSRSEARLATLLCDGVALRSAAAELGWTEETARSCSKKIFSRTEVRGQAGLLRKMLGGAVWFRGGGKTG